MALDVGDARIGVALSDALCLTAQPHSTVERSGGRSVQALLQIAQRENVGQVVVGMPYELSGEIGAQGQKVEEFVVDLRSAILRRPELQHVGVHLWDERFTTAEAKRVLVSSKLKNKDSSAALDRISAAIILDGYLNSSC